VQHADRHTDRLRATPVAIGRIYTLPFNNYRNGRLFVFDRVALRVIADDYVVHAMSDYVVTLGGRKGGRGLALRTTSLNLIFVLRC